MRNLTEYNDEFILSLIKQSGGNPWKCTANVQYAVEFNRLVPVLVIYQDYSVDWDNDDRCIYCEEIAALDFCEAWHINTVDLDAMIEYYNKVAFQKAVDEIEYEMECEKYEQALLEEYNWYIKARQMGWE